MKIYTFLWILGIAWSCQERQPDSGKKLSNASIPFLPDTIVASKLITNEIAGETYRSRAKGYTLVAGLDTSQFMCIVTESKEGSQVGMDLRFQNSMSYQQQLLELSKIIPEVAKDFHLDSLSTIFIGRLVTTGDLALAVTNQYINQYGNTQKIKDKKAFAAFLQTSSIASDFNRLFEPYSISVKAVYPEKVFFTTKQELFHMSKIETDSASIPGHILDCMTWVGFK